MKHILKYSTIVLLGLAIAGPALAATGIVLPTNPASGGTALTGSGVVTIITQIVNYLITISVVIAVAAIIWGAITVFRDPAKGKSILLRAVIGLAIILGVGLILNTIAGLVNRGLNVG